MSQDIANRIRYYRIKSKMTQSELSEGIISVSYLSKIENGVAQPQKEIINLLSKRLNIQPNPITDEKLLSLSNTWFGYLLNGKKEEATKLYKTLEANRDITNSHILKLFEIHKLCYFVLCKDEVQADQQYNFLKRKIKIIEGREKYYWLKFSGYYYSSKLSYEKAIEHYQEAQNYLNYDLFRKDDEENHLFYLTARIASKLKQPYLTIVYANKALNYYRNHYKLRWAAQCHILLGIAYQRTGEFKKSKKNYELAITIAEMIKDEHTRILCIQNLGKLYSITGQFDEAINYYLKSYELKVNETNESKIITISSLMKEYYSKGDMHHSKKWLEKGLELTAKLDPSQSIYVFEFEVYKQLIEGVTNSFEDLITNRILPFLEDRKLYHEKHVYQKLLGDYYYQNRRYKLAADYYNLADDTSTKMYLTNRSEI